MQIDIAPHIEKLLFEHDTVIIPGLGGFISHKSAATIDYGGNTITPPSKTLSFNENLSTDDGLLVHSVSQSLSVSDADAADAVRQFVEKTHRQLDQREIVTLPGVGRLYKNYVQKIQFLPDATNFRQESYGLPPLQFSPIARSREVAEPTATSATPPPTLQPLPPAPPPVSVAPEPPLPPPPVAPPPPEKKTSEFSADLPSYEAAVDPYDTSSKLSLGRILLIAVLLAISAAIGYYLWQRQNAAMNEEIVLSQDEDTTPGASQNDETINIRPAAEPQPARPQPEPPPKKTAAPTQLGQCVLVIGIFSDPGNIKRLTGKLRNNGYEIYEAPMKSGKQIGIVFNYASQSEIQGKVNELKRLTGEKNIIVKKR